MVKKTEKKPKSASITYSQPFAATIHKGPDGVNKLKIASQRWYHYQLSKFKDGEKVTLEVHNMRPKRSDQQNRYYWGVYLPLIAEKSGEEQRSKKYIDILHRRFAGEFLGQGIYESYGKKVRLTKSTTELSVSDFCKYIMDIEELTGIEAPPTENYDLPALDWDSWYNSRSRYPHTK